MLLDLTDCLTQSGGLLTAYAPTTAATHINTASGSYIDRNIPMDDGFGAPLWFYFTTVTAASTGSSPTINLQLLGNPSDPTFSSGNVVIAQTGVLAASVFVAQYHQAIPVDTQPFAEYLAIGTPLRYYAFAVVIATAALTTGSWYAWMTNQGIQSNNQYAAGYSV
jgi:hypothetical protein